MSVRFWQEPLNVDIVLVVSIWHCQCQGVSSSLIIYSMEMKRCSKCKELKPISEFAINKTKKDEHASDCKACRKIYRDKHYQENKEYYKTKLLNIKGRK